VRLVVLLLADRDNHSVIDAVFDRAVSDRAVFVGRGFGRDISNRPSWGL
jgi:hypothetical protein